MIVASIMSKKLAEGLDVLVLDVKTGTGAFMERESEAFKLARALVRTGKAFGVRTEAMITDMNQPLGKYAGNALEVFECIKLLRSEPEPQMAQTLELSIELTARMLVLSGIASSQRKAKIKIGEALSNGAALEKLRENIKAQGGNPRLCDTPEKLVDNSLLKVKIRSPESGYILGIDAKEIGKAIALIGAILVAKAFPDCQEVPTGAYADLHAKHLGPDRFRHPHCAQAHRCGRARQRRRGRAAGGASLRPVVDGGPAVCRPARG